MTVSELIHHLSTLPGDYHVGTTVLEITGTSSSWAIDDIRVDETDKRVLISSTDIMGNEEPRKAT